MSTRPLQEALDVLSDHATTDCQSAEAATKVQAKLDAAWTALRAIEKAAKDLARLHIGDFTDNIAHRHNVIAAMTADPESQWNHPDVKAWSDASQLLAAIAKESES